MATTKEKFDRMRCVVVAKVQDLKPEERYNILEKLAVQYASDMAVTLKRKYNESDKQLRSASLALSPKQIKDVHEGEWLNFLEHCFPS